MPTLAELVRAKHPGAYDDLDDAALEKAVLAKYPQYADLAKPAEPSVASRAVDTAKDVGVGFAKGLANTITGPSILAPLINKMTVAATGDRRAAVPEENASTEFLKKFDATNKAQVAGKVAEFGAEVLGPSAISRVAKFAASRKAAAPVAAGVTKAITAESPRLAGKAPVLQDVLKEALEAARGPMQTTAKVSLPPSNLARVVEETAPRLAKKAAPVAEAAAPAVEKIAQEAETHLATGNVEQAASTIEKKVKLTVAELMRLGRDKYGSQRAGKMLQPNMPAKVGAAQVKRLAPGASKLPEFAIDDMAKRGTSLEDFQKMLGRVGNEEGGINPSLLLHGTGAAVGAAAGATQGDTTTEKLTNAAAGGVLGGLTTSFIAHAAAQGVPKAMQSFIYSSVLSSPSSVAKAYLGGAGGAISVAMEKIAAGEGAAGGRILQSLFSPSHVTEMVRAFRSPTLAQTGRVTGAPSLIGRVFEAVNAPAVRAMQRGGVSLDDAIRATLSGTPTTPIGQDLLGLWSRYFPLRLATTLFPRVGVQILERGIERSPLGLLPLKGINEGATVGARIARAGMGTAAGLAAATKGDQMPDWAKPYATALSATYALPVGLGLAVGKAKGSGKNAAGQVMAGTQEVTRNLPFPQYGPADALNPAGSLSAMMVPNVVRDIARMRDPQERKTAGVPFGRAMAKIPGLRETLPVAGKAVNIAGQPNEGERGPLQRFFNASAKENVPFKDVPERVAVELKRLQIPINVPSFERELEIGKRKIAIPADVAERARGERRQYLIPQIEKLMASPSYVRADDPRKAVLLKAVISRAESAGSSRSRANVIKTLRQQGAFAK